MSTKASSLNASANNSPIDSTMNITSTIAATPTVVKIKKELPSDEIKEFAESTMNELLGWYGFDSADRLDLSAKTSKLLQTAGIISRQQQQQHNHHHAAHHLENRRSRASRPTSLLHMHQQQQQQNDHSRALKDSNSSIHSSSNNNSINNNNNSNNKISSCSSNNRKTSFNCKNNSNKNYRGTDSTTSDHDTRSSRDDDSKSPFSANKIHTPSMNIIDDKAVDFQNCCWCRRPVPENAPEFLTTSDGPRYCSESCFTQSRRASFKKAKTCDWCKHVRHAVSYVDFQDGASQLQFCSDKCLNQYKMQIFCKETQAHLDLNPHLKEQGLDAANNGANLITPDLWLRNCRSRSASPASTVSISPGSPGQTNVGQERSNVTSGAISPPPKLTIASSLATNSNTSHKPLISVAPVSKLMSKSPSIFPTRQSPKHNRKRRPVRSCVGDESPQTRLNEVKINNSAALPALGNKPKPLLAALGESSRCNLNQTNTQTLTQFAASCVQDLHMNVPPLSPMLESQSSQPTTPHSIPSTPNRGPTTISSSYFGTAPNSQVPQSAQGVGMTPQSFAPRPSFLHIPNEGFIPRFLGNFATLPPPPLHTPAGLMPTDLSALNTLIGTPPPVTIMVPYPVIIPLPIPIPVPLPVVDFYKAHLTPEDRKKYDEEQKNNIEIKIDVLSSVEVAEEPLDFTKTKETEQKVVETEKRDEDEAVKHISGKEANQNLEPSLQNNSKDAEEPSAISSTTSKNHQNTSESLHCILTIEENEQHGDTDNTSNNLKSGSTTNAQGINEDLNALQSNTVAVGLETNQKLPKLKITRLQTKRSLIQTKESECSRPLRKRKRIIDCDFQKLNTSNKEANDVADDLYTTTENEQTNKGQNTNSNSNYSNNNNNNNK